MAEVEEEVKESRVIFVTGDHAYTVREVIDAAQIRGELAAPWERFLQVVAAESRAEETELELDDSAIDSAAEQFRYEHDLITAEETEKWLAERGLTLGDFSDYFVRHYWPDVIGEVKPAAIEYVDAPEDSRALFTTDLILSGELDRMAERLSRRVAARRAARERAIDQALVEQAEKGLRERTKLGGEDVGESLGKLGRDPEWLREQLTMEAIYERDCAALLTREARGREISALRLPLTLFEVETIEFDSLDSAREALLCVRQDGMTMEEVATEGRYPYRHTEVLLEDVPEDLQQKFLSVVPGELLEPITRGDGFHLCRIIGKAEPNVDDPTVKQRAEDRILDRYFADLTSRHLQWRTILP